MVLFWRIARKSVVDGEGFYKESALASQASQEWVHRTESYEIDQINREHVQLSSSSLLNPCIWNQYITTRQFIWRALMTEVVGSSRMHSSHGAVRSPVDFSA